jgi:protein arginine kinase activator
MLCENCKENEANVHYKHLEAGKSSVMHLCIKCATDKGIYGGKPKMNLSDFLDGLMENAGVEWNPPQNELSGKTPVERCPKCGMTFNDFRRAGKAGCAECYEIYGRRMEPLMKRLHGNILHKGRIPEALRVQILADRELNSLKDLLKKAVEEEKYEKAAEIRDQIKRIEKETV